MNARERRRKRILETIRHYQEKLDQIDPAKYRRERDYRRLATFYRNRIAWGLKLLEGSHEASNKHRARLPRRRRGAGGAGALSRLRPDRVVGRRGAARSRAVPDKGGSPALCVQIPQHSATI